MEALTLSEIQKISTDILISFDVFCREHNIKYSLGEGTLIGAVRHKGFIPWDDDIDILMLRDDYERFIQLYCLSDHHKYELITIRKKGKWCSCYSRLTDKNTYVVFSNGTIPGHGVWISLLPIDYYPGDEKWNRMTKEISFWFKLGRLKSSQWLKGLKFHRNFAKLIGRIAIKPISYYYIGNKLNRLLQSGTKGSQLASMAPLWHAPWIFPKEVFDNYVELPFEGKSFLSMGGYDTYLRIQYGDYMKLPPEEKRSPIHEFDVYKK